MKVVQEHIHLPGRSLRFLNLSLGAFRAKRHRHPQIELTWIEHGTGVRFVGDSAEAFGPGDMVLLGSDLAHTWISTPVADDRPLRAKVIQFEPAGLQHAPIPELQPLIELTRLARRGLRVTAEAHAQAARLLLAMEGASPLERFLGLLQILQALAQHPEDLQPITSAPSSADGGTDAARKRRIDRVLEWVRAHLDEPLSAHDAAKVAHVTPAAFARFFRREMGKTLADYVNEIRCAQACVLLRSSDEPVNRIAVECGFGAGSNFSRRFRQAVGLTPRAYRKFGL